MPTRPPREPLTVLVLAALAVAAAAVLIAAGGRSKSSQAQAEASWQGLAGGLRPRVAVGQRVIVVLKAPSVADRVANVGGLATSEEERRWRESALAAQRLLVARLRVQGVVAQPEFSYTRTINGFSAAFDARGVALLERAPDVAAVYPVRTAYPAALTAGQLPSQFGTRADITLSDRDGRGVTIALLDTGVDRAQPILRGRVERGIDIIGGGAGASAAPQPDEPAELERHGTELAGLLVGSGAPGAPSGVAPGATVLPIRVAGWQRDASAKWAVYGRTDQVLAGLERAVDPNADGDAHDAARIALIGVVEPFAAFADGPLALAASGARRLDTLVVAPAGNDGPAGPGYGSVAGPGGAPDVLTVGAVDLRPRYGRARVVVRTGLHVDFDGTRPLAGAVSPSQPLDVGVGAPRARTTAPVGYRGAVPLLDFFDKRGGSLVAGRAALLRAGGPDPDGSVANAERAGAVAALYYGADLPPGAIPLGASAPIPVISIPIELAHRLLRAAQRGRPTTVSIGAVREAPNTGDGRVARFSSTGLAFDGRVKPELVAPGVALETAEAGTNADGSARYGTINGTSAAAALVAGAAALLAQARSYLDADALESLLVGSARPIRNDRVIAQGAGLVDVGGAAATEIGAAPSSLAFGRAESSRWRGEQAVDVRNLSVRPLRVAAEVRVAREGAAAVNFDVRPKRFWIRGGQAIRVHVRARVASRLEGSAAAEGAVLLTPIGSRQVRVPWTILFGARRPPTLSSVRLSTRSFSPSDAAPALLTLVAGSVPSEGGTPEVVPLSRLDLELWSPEGGRIGLLARLRDVLPGRYSFGVTGRDPTGAVLPPGTYQLKLVAYGTDPGPPTTRTIGITIK